MVAFLQTTFWNAFWNGNICILIANSLKCVSLDNGLAPNRPQHNIWTTVDQDICMTSLCHNRLQKGHIAWNKTMEPYVYQMIYISHINDGYFHSWTTNKCCNSNHKGTGTVKTSRNNMTQYGNNSTDDTVLGCTFSYALNGKNIQIE